MENQPKIELEYRITSPSDDSTGVSEVRGEYDNPDVAYEVAYALCRREQEILGWPLGDLRIRYPESIKGIAAPRCTRAGQRQPSAG